MIAPWLGLEDDPGGDPSGFDISHGFVDAVEVAHLLDQAVQGCLVGEGPGGVAKPGVPAKDGDAYAKDLEKSRAYYSELLKTIKMSDD